MRLLLTLLLLLLIPNAYCYRYLFQSINIAYSHLSYGAKLADLLVEDGHDVDFIVRKYNTFVNSYGVKKANLIVHENKYIKKINKLMASLPMYHNVFEQSGDIFTFNGVNTLHKILSTGCFGTIEDVQLIQSLKGKKYDAAFVEHLDACGLIVAELVGIKTVMLFSVQGVSFPARYYLNLPSAPGFVPVYNEVPPSGYEMSFVERAMNLYNYWRYEMYIPKKLLGVAAKLQSADLLPKDFPSVEELGSQISYLFVNSVEFLNFPDFYTPQVKHIGGIGMPKAGNVDNFILPIIEKAKKGVVWFSFGSIVNTKLMNARIRQSFIAAFSQFEEYEFLWQMKDIDEDVKNAFASYNNIHLIEWLNQPALLAHNKTKAMISHGGLTGLFEAINYGVPLISIPMFMDHKRSAALAKYHGIGVILDKYTLTVDKIASALREVLESEIYQQNILKKQKMLKDANPKPEEVFLHSVKYATEHGEELKKINIPRVNWITYFCLDIVVLIFITLVILIAIFVKILKRITNLTKGRGKKVNKVKKN